MKTWLYFILLGLSAALELQSQDLPEDLREVLHTGRYKLSNDPVLEGWNYSIFKLTHEGREWALKIIKADRLENIKSEFEALTQLGPQFSPKVVVLRTQNDEYLIKEWVNGPTLHDAVISGVFFTNPGMVTGLQTLFSELMRQFPSKYVTDLHGSNLVWSNSEQKWFIIDTNGIKPSSLDPAIFYYLEMETHWNADIERQIDTAGESSIKKFNAISLKIFEQEILKLNNGKLMFEIFCQKKPFAIVSNNHTWRYSPEKPIFQLARGYDEKFCFQFFNRDEIAFLGFDPDSKTFNTKNYCNRWEEFSISIVADQFEIKTFTGDPISKELGAQYKFALYPDCLVTSDCEGF